MNIYDDVLKEFTLGITKKDWNRILDNYLENKNLTVEDWESLNQEQQQFIQELRRAYARISRKN
jgi:uncharacterized protein YpuA (DUF1002 family)